MVLDLFWGVLLTGSVIGVLGAWFRRCGRADRQRDVRAFAKRTLLYAGTGCVLGLAFLTSDLGTPGAASNIGITAFTVCCFLLVYSAAWAMTAANDRAPVVVNLTGRALLLADPALAPFFTLPAPRDQPATTLPPHSPNTFYVVSPELAMIGARAGRTDIFTVDRATSSDYGEGQPLLVRRLLRPPSPSPTDPTVE